MLMNLIKRLRASARDERGFAMIFALMIMLVCTLLVAGAILSSTEDVSLTRTYSNQQRAYDAALAGVDAYKYQLAANSTYWSTCPKTSAPVAIPRSKNEIAEGSPEETYTYETLPSSGHVCESKLSSIIESQGSASGTFRILATGTIVGSKCAKEAACKREIVATFDHPSFLNYVFVSNYEQVDPATVEAPTTSECEVYYKEREELRAKGKIQKCVPFPWISEDAIEGPFHTNDASDISGTPTFGRPGHKDAIEMVQGYFGGTPTLNGTLIKGGPLLYPPETGAELIQEAGTKYKGRTVIVLKNGGTMEVKNNGETKASVAVPSNGVIAVENGSKGCTVTYTPFFPSYTNDTECGDVYVSGEYNQSLTIIAENDVIVNGNITTTGGSTGLEPTGTATLGLIADKYVRLYHPVKGGCESGKSSSCKSEETPAGSAEYNCSSNAENAVSTTDTATKELGGALKNPIIDAALLSTKNSWGVDNFACGAELGTITVWGSIAENWRGRVTCCASGGDYVKSYKWDSRLENDQPPDFLAPGVNSGWKIERETAPPE
jgi:hypothetical protein